MPAASSCAATRKSEASRKGAATSWTPSGSAQCRELRDLILADAHGLTHAGAPLRLAM